MSIAAGEKVPDFTLAREDGSTFTQADIAGQTAVFVFYPFAFSPVCTDQLNLYEEVLDQFAAQGATLYGVSCDSTWAQRAFKEKLGVTIEQLSDFEPKGAMCKAFGVLHAGRLPGAGDRDRQPRRHGQVELSGAVTGRSARREPDLRRPRELVANAS